MRRRSSSGIATRWRQTGPEQQHSATSRNSAGHHEPADQEHQVARLRFVADHHASAVPSATRHPWAQPSTRNVGSVLPSSVAFHPTLKLRTVDRTDAGPDPTTSSWRVAVSDTVRRLRDVASPGARGRSLGDHPHGDRLELLRRRQPGRGASPRVSGIAGEARHDPQRAGRDHVTDEARDARRVALPVHVQARAESAHGARAVSAAERHVRLRGPRKSSPTPIGDEPRVGLAKVISRCRVRSGANRPNSPSSTVRVPCFERSTAVIGVTAGAAGGAPRSG